MRSSSQIQLVFRLFLSALWLWNGAYCKLFGGVPRHRQIVGEILGEEHAIFFTKMIGAMEVLLAIWILTGWKARLCYILQIILILTMNLIEWTLVPELLLFGRYNLLLAAILCGLICLFTPAGDTPSKEKARHA